MHNMDIFMRNCFKNAKLQGEIHSLSGSRPFCYKYSLSYFNEENETFLSSMIKSELKLGSGNRMDTLR